VRHLQNGCVETAAAQFDALHREFPDDPCIWFHCRRLAEGERGTLIVMAEK